MFFSECFGGEGRAIRNVLSDKAAEATNINIAAPPPPTHNFQNPWIIRT